jgi:hypothetical protein
MHIPSYHLDIKNLNKPLEAHFKTTYNYISMNMNKQINVEFSKLTINDDSGVVF